MRERDPVNCHTQTDLLSVVIPQGKMDPQSKIVNVENRQFNHHDVSADQSAGLHHPTDGHNPSAQQNVLPNPDLALHYSHEHQNQHLHHEERAIDGRDNDLLYSHDPTADKYNIPTQNAQDSHRQAHWGDEKTAIKLGVIHQDTDAENGVISPPPPSPDKDDPRSHKFSGLYSKWKILFHAMFLALMTGHAYSLHVTLLSQANQQPWQMVDSSPYPPQTRSWMDHTFPLVALHHSPDRHFLRPYLSRHETVQISLEAHCSASSRPDSR